MNLLSLLLFKLISFLYQLWTSAENLINGFIRYVYIPLFHSIDHPKMVSDLHSLPKKPEEVTLVCEIRGTRAVDMRRSALKIARYARVIEEGLRPVSLNCYLETSFTKEGESEELKSILREILTEENSQAKILFPSDFNYGEKINCEKRICTPLVIVFSSYPSVLGLHPSFLVGAEISFQPQLLRATDYDLYSSLHSYASSEQRKGK